MADFWMAGQDVIDEANDLIAQYHPEIATATFAIVFKDKATNSEIEAGIVAVAKKVSPMFKLLTKDLDFIIVLAKNSWDELSMAERTAHLDSALCSCTAKLDESGDFKLDEAGNPIFCLRPFDLQGHSEVIARFGVEAFADVGERLKHAIATNQTNTAAASNAP